MTKAFICLAGGLIGFPMIALATLQTSSFWLSMVSYCVSTFFTSAFVAQAITMLQNANSSAMRSTVVATFLFNGTTAQTLAPFVFNLLANTFQASNNPVIFGRLISFMTFTGLVGSIPVWLLAGRAYTKKMNESAA